MDAMSLACLGAATILPVILSRPLIRDALGADITVSGGMTKKSVAGANAPGAQAAASPLSYPCPAPPRAERLQ